MRSSPHKTQVLERFLRYVRIDTRSNETTGMHPSTANQFVLARLLVLELQAMGICDAAVDEHCYVTATIPASPAVTDPLVIGLIAHLDTSPEVSGENVTPVVHEYCGGDIMVSKEHGVVITTNENPALAHAVGHTIVTAGGTTLLGADDKAGVAAIMTLAAHMVTHPEVSHHTIRLGFTPDEEIGQGVSHFRIPEFGADFAYTVDGGSTGEINCETFSADAALVKVTGRDIHPGAAKDRMVNSLRVAAAIIDRLPRDMAPETTSNREGFIHPHTLQGGVGATQLKLLFRDFTEAGLLQKRALLENIISEVGGVFPEAGITLDVKPGYRNMFTALQEKPGVLNRLEQAVLKTGITPEWKPVRGGTDGSVLTERGLLTPNIFTGACNMHSLTEWVDIDGLAKAVEVLVNVVGE